MKSATTIAVLEPAVTRVFAESCQQNPSVMPAFPALAAGLHPAWIIQNTANCAHQGDSLWALTEANMVVATFARNVVPQRTKTRSGKVPAKGVRTDGPVRQWG